VQPSLQQVTTTTTDVSIAQKNNPFFDQTANCSRPFSTTIDRKQLFVVCRWRMILRWLLMWVVFFLGGVRFLV
jgi:hypothetical protein